MSNGKVFKEFIILIIKSEPGIFFRHIVRILGIDEFTLT